MAAFDMNLNTEQLLSCEDQKIVAKARSILANLLQRGPMLASYDAVIDYAHITIGATKREKFHVLFLDRRNRLIKDVCMWEGTIDHTPVYPREVLKLALQLDACALIVIHNHPSGDPTPSSSDIEQTAALRSVAENLGMVLHDHIIVAQGGETSFRAEGLI